MLLDDLTLETGHCTALIYMGFQKFNVLGLDLGLTRSGWLSVDHNGHWQSGLLEPKKVMGVPRLAMLRSKLIRLLDATQPALAVIEDYSYNSINKSQGMGEWGGVARLVLWDRGIPFVTVPPSTAYWLTVNPQEKSGLTKKAETQRWAETMGLPHAQEDMCDAGMLAVVGRLVRGEPPHQLLVKRQLTSLAKLEIVYPPRVRKSRETSFT